MKNFEEIAEKCLKGELSGTFTCDLNGELIKVPSENLSRYGNLYELKYPGPHTYDHYNSNGFSVPYEYNEVINFIPDIKQNDKRTIQVTLCQAREWYNSGNNTLRTLALSSFSKEELDLYSKSWQDYLNNHSGFLLSLIAPEPMCSKVIAYTKLLLLREEWIHIWSQEQGLKKDWEPNWNNGGETKFVIFSKADCLGGITVDSSTSWTFPLSFPTIKLAKDFLNTFRVYLKDAKGLY